MERHVEQLPAQGAQVAIAGERVEAGQQRDGLLARYCGRRIEKGQAALVGTEQRAQE
jgi:hypothetical protein